jgi:hypothetical protein
MWLTRQRIMANSYPRYGYRDKAKRQVYMRDCMRFRRARVVNRPIRGMGLLDGTMRRPGHHSNPPGC